MRTQVVQSLQEIITKQRVDPIPGRYKEISMPQPLCCSVILKNLDASLAVLLKLIATALDGHQTNQSFDLKLVYRGDFFLNLTSLEGGFDIAGVFVQ